MNTIFNLHIGTDRHEQAAYVNDVSQCASNEYPQQYVLCRNQKKKNVSIPISLCKPCISLYNMGNKESTFWLSSKLTLVKLNKLPHPCLIFSQSNYLIQEFDTSTHTHVLNDKQCRSKSVSFFRSQLIWIYTVCKCRAYPGSAGPGLRHIYAVRKLARSKTTH